MQIAQPIGGGAHGARGPRRRRVILVLAVMLGLVVPTAVVAADAPNSDTTQDVDATAVTDPTDAPTAAPTEPGSTEPGSTEPGSTEPDPTVSTTTVAPATTRPMVAQRPVAPSRQAPGRASRGRARQVTPTLPPPTTTTTLPWYMVLPAGSGEGRRVVYSISRQRVWAVESNGAIVKTHAVSGKSGIPSPGTYSVFSRSLHTHSIKNPAIKWMYMVRFTKGPEGDNIGFHEIPTQCDRYGRCWKLQSESQLGIPLSGGCVRQSTPDAIWMWDWAQLGTKVVVVA